MSDFCEGTIVTDFGKVLPLSPVNTVPTPNGLVSNVPVGDFTIPLNTIELGYSIISMHPNKLNEIIKGSTGSLENFRKVSFTKQVNTSLVANSLNPEFEPITKWSINTFPELSFSKTIYAGTDPFKNIATNKDLWYQQIAGLEEAVNNFLITTLYPNGYSSSRVNIRMGEYPIYEGISGLKRQEVTCFNLLRQFKACSGKNLKIISKYENVACLDLNWTCYNKSTVGEVFVSVEQIVNNPMVDANSPYSSDCGCVEEVNCNDQNYYNSVAPCATEDVSGTSTYFPCDQGYTGHVHNKNAETFYPYINNLSSNLVILKNTVYVDAFCENDTIYKLNPYILQLDFYTEFYFQMVEKPEVSAGDHEVCPNDIPWNPSPSVYVPQHPVLEDYRVTD